eukprot:831491-Pelagomonas_calceolata.AAC.5
MTQQLGICVPAMFSFWAARLKSALVFEDRLQHWHLFIHCALAPNPPAISLFSSLANVLSISLRVGQGDLAFSAVIPQVVSSRALRQAAQTCCDSLPASAVGTWSTIS